MRPTLCTGHGTKRENGPWRISRFRMADFGPRHSSTRLRFRFEFTYQDTLWNAAALDDVWVWDIDCARPEP